MAGTPGPSRPYVALGLLCSVASALLTGRTGPFLVFLVLVTAYVLRNQLSAAPRLDPTLLALVADVAVLVAFPFVRLPHDRTMSYVVVLALLAMSVPPLVRTDAVRVRGQALLVALFGLLGVSSVLSPDAGAVKAVLTIGVATVLPFLLAGRLEPERFELFAAAVVAMASLQSVLAIVEPFLFPHHLWTTAQLDLDGSIVPLVNPVLPGNERSQGTLGHPLLLGLLLLMGLALLLRVLVQIPPPLSVAVTVLLLGGLVSTGSRSELIGAVALVVVGRGASVMRVAAAVGSLVVGLGALVSAGVLSSGPVQQLLTSGSFLHRASTFDSLVKLLYTQAWPRVFMGNGFLSTQRVYATGRLQTDGFQVVDNQFVLSLSQGGLIGMLLLMAVILTAVFCAPVRLRPAVVAVALTLFVFDTLTSPAASALSFSILGLACSRSGQKAEVVDRRDTQQAQSRRPAQPVLVRPSSSPPT